MIFALVGSTVCVVHTQLRPLRITNQFFAIPIEQPSRDLEKDRNCSNIWDPGRTRRSPPVELAANDNTIYNFIWVDPKEGPPGG